ncbi:MAG TPA: hypothetical protein VMM58_08065 [Bacteroidota bacterium]|nr:hypothetical protein [Bacteroidota bacterium]
MFEKETEQLIGVVRQATIGDNKSIGLREIFESNIPTSVKVFFRAEVETMLHAERRPETRSQKFDYDAPEITMLQDQIDALLIHNFVFPKNDFETTLDKCVHFLFNYLCRPQWTLNSFLFEDSGRASSAQILSKLRYCRDYVYFPDILRTYLQQRGVQEMTLEEGRNLIARIDAEVSRNHTSVELARMTTPLYEFVAYARSHNLSATAKTIPTRALMYFFEDKKIAAIHERLSREREVNGMKEMSSNQLVNLIEKVRTGDERAHLFDDSAEPLPAGDETTFDLPTLPAKREEPDFSIQEISEPPKPLPPLFSLEEERSIIKYVFNQSEEQFRAAMHEALAASSWDDAALTIDHFFLMNDVEPFTKEAILFTNRLQDRFSEKIRNSNF